MQSIGIVAILYELVGNLLCLHAGAAEDDAIDVRVVVGNTLQCKIFVFGVYHIIYVVHILGTFVFVANHDFMCVGEVVLGYGSYLLAHRGREEQCISVSGYILEDTVYTIGEAHVEHFVSFVEHHIAYCREIYDTAFHEVDKSARGSHNDVYATAYVAYLVLYGCATIHRYYAQSFHIFGERGEIIGNLQT